VIGGVEANLGPSVEQEKFDQIITHMRNQEKETKVMKNLLESYNQEMVEMKKGSSVISSNFEKLTEAINKVISDYKEIKQSMRQWEERHEMVNEKIKWLENGHRKNNILIFGLEERRGERYSDTLEVAKKFLRETMKLEVLNESIDYVARVGNRSGERPILMKLTSLDEARSVKEN
jgi:chromosome segregation ATPase